eukprot:TRINITY_DN110767_c0_g1_i1.p1 TRINITY_DN110767_c0_g1~~TRINITY_DN110767_c0_g1_i1.p1  ORF type:complete len:103 (-),score=23.97 TRINITY_DN110767_c0_g1_i1:30-338(-)
MDAIDLNNVPDWNPTTCDDELGDKVSDPMAVTQLAMEATTVKKEVSDAHFRIQGLLNEAHGLSHEEKSDLKAKSDALEKAKTYFTLKEAYLQTKMKDLMAKR